MKRSITLSLFALTILATSAIGTTTVQADTIVDIAVGNEDFSNLVEAVVAQDLVETLASEGPFTVFAPTNAAFASLPAFIPTLLTERPELLTQILLYHVVAGDLVAADVLEQEMIETVQGDSLQVSLRDDNAFVNNAQIVAIDIDASNGTIHVIDTVLLPNAIYAAIIDVIRLQIEALIQTRSSAQYTH